MDGLTTERHQQKGRREGARFVVGGVAAIAQCGQGFDFAELTAFDFRHMPQHVPQERGTKNRN
ncbi:hypothetical protein [Nevskia soli]|uniref:hypothetical protein n=1 Tax=Nevskia soli TaxID=418856 RepID=UPI0012F903C2|nr:hypothetical protein [Nevskia soli]